MKLKLLFNLFTIVVLVTILLVVGTEINAKTNAQINIHLQVPFDKSKTYRVTSYVDHASPNYSEDGSIVLFNGETYVNCPDSGEIWTNQGPYCYHGHSGTDLAMEENTPVLATASGTVIDLIELDPSASTPNFGNYVIVNHDNGYLTLYTHLADFSVEEGDKVNAGDQIGLSGNSGMGTPGQNYHLHFEVRYSHNQRATDPFGWRGNTPDPLIEYSGETAVCLWANEWCNETLVEDGDVNHDGTVVKFTHFGELEWAAVGNSWTTSYTAGVSGDETTSAYWIPHLTNDGPHEVFVFIPKFANKTRVTYTIHDRNDAYFYSIDQSEYNDEEVSLGTYDFGTGANNYVMLTNQVGESGKTVVFDSVKFRQFRSYLPVITRAPDAPTPQPNSCYVGRVLVEDGYENGDPFGEGTGTAGPWGRDAYDGFPNLPQKVGLGDFNNPVPRPSGDDGLKFGGEDNEDLGEDRGDLDQLAFVTVFIPAGTKKVKTTFDVLLISEQSPTTSDQYDHLYWGLQTTLDTGNLNARYDCNEDVATQSPHRICWNDTWISPTTIEVTMNEVWPPAENSIAYAGFWVDVSRYAPSWFYIDNFKMVITECE